MGHSLIRGGSKRPSRSNSRRSGAGLGTAFEAVGLWFGFLAFLPDAVRGGARFLEDRAASMKVEQVERGMSLPAVTAAELLVLEVVEHLGDASRERIVRFERLWAVTETFDSPGR